MNNKDNKLIYEAYQGGLTQIPAPEVVYDINTSPSNDHSEVRFDPQTGQPIDREGWIGGERGYGFSTIFNGKIQALLAEPLKDDEKLQQCLKVRDQAVNIIKNFQAILSSLDVDSAIDLLCLKNISGKLIGDENRHKIWDALSRYDPSRVKDIPPDRLLSHILQRNFSYSESGDCKTAREMLDLPVFGKHITKAIFSIIKKISNLVMNHLAEPFLQDMQTLETLDDFQNIDLILLQYDAKVLKIGKKFMQWFEGFTKTVMLILSAAIKVTGAAGGAIGGTLRIAAQSPNFVRSAQRKLQNIETPALPNKPPVLQLPNK